MCPWLCSALVLSAERLFVLRDPEKPLPLSVELQFYSALAQGIRALRAADYAPDTLDEDSPRHFHPQEQTAARDRTANHDAPGSAYH